MSQPRRRRRRGRRGGGGAEGAAAGAAGSKPAPVRETAQGSSDPSSGAGKGRRRRGRGRAGGRQTSSPKSSEDLVRALPRERPDTLTAEHDGQTLEAIIGDLQSTWGVPPYPQEYRITIKVAEERETRSTESANGEGQTREPRATERPPREKAAPRGDQPRREKAPAAPGITQSPGAARERPNRKRRRRRRRGGGAPGGDAGGGSPDTGGS
jgi:hypothetical protein